MTSHDISSDLARELAVEQAHVDKVYERLAIATKDAQRAAQAGASRYTSDRGDYLREEDATSVYERDVFAYQAAKRLAVLEAEHEGLVFGRLDLTNGDTDYIGRIGVHDDDYEPLVIDWRARAAEPFYRATAADPMDVIRRRVLRCRDDRVIGIEDDLLDGASAPVDLPVIGEGALMAALSRARGHQMRDIVATIQGEQDEAIRAPYQGVTIISGGPGTGKTVVALHRAAYLLYTHRRRFEQGGVLVVGPSDVFMTYIERVLPSLGEESVTLRSVGSVPSDVLPVDAHRTDDSRAAVIKGSVRMVDVLARLVQVPATVSVVGRTGHQPKLDRDFLVTVKGNALRLTGKSLMGLRRQTVRQTKANHARRAGRDAIISALWDLMPPDHGLERDAFTDLVSDHPAVVEALNTWWPTQHATVELRRLSYPEVVARVADGLLDAQEQLELLASFAELGAEGHEDWSVADVALLDELVSLLGTPLDEAADEPLFLTADAQVSEIITLSDRLTHERTDDPYADRFETFAHVLVDEAQDITPMQWRMLRRRGAQASWTIVGDPAQSSWPDRHELDAEIRALVGLGQQRTFRMSTNYRSPAEVFDLAAKVVSRDFPDADLPTAVRSTGIAPDLRTVHRGDLADTLQELVDDLSTQVGGTIGVITPPARQYDIEELLDGLAVDDAVRDRVVCVNTLQAKGLEYDAVIVIAPDEIIAQHIGGSRILYVALTRPTQRLVTLDLVPNGAALTPGAWRVDLD
ncbi:HelD family protein [Raineyella fluvialis]|uniref:AAA family ATPase n=1 Tax=Raineyella fluvialis TaxID=2662261 RepID=A0A5Q2FBQ5_9ACTN|nr:UvrD-helicase domain-containing protein [Raineyella fluvialis]QGF24219.1 AAA family ATPase [Raineyella fluvialis]